MAPLQQGNEATASVPIGWKTDLKGLSLPVEENSDEYIVDQIIGKRLPIKTKEQVMIVKRQSDTTADKRDVDLSV